MRRRTYWHGDSVAYLGDAEQNSGTKNICYGNCAIFDIDIDIDIRR